MTAVGEAFRTEARLRLARPDMAEATWRERPVLLARMDFRGRWIDWRAKS